MCDFEIWPGPMEGVGRGGFIQAVNQLKLAARWMTPFFRISGELPRLTFMKRFLADFQNGGVPVALQLMGRDPGLLGEAGTLFAAMEQVESINLNCGCPSRRVVSGGVGGGALRAPAKLEQLCCQLRQRLPESVALTIKLRAGWSSPEEMEQILPRLRDSGAVSKIFFHYRTVSELYSPEALPYRAGRFARAVELCGDIPVIINGDIASADEAEKLVQQCGAAGVMSARPWMRDPFLLRRMSGETSPEPEAGRELFFETARQCGVPPGGLIELFRMLWGSNDPRFKEFVAGMAGRMK